MDLVFAQNEAFCTILIFEKISQIILSKYAQILMRVMRNIAEYCAKVVPLHAQMMRKSSKKNASYNTHFAQKMPFRENPT